MFSPKEIPAMRKIAFLAAIFVSLAVPGVAGAQQHKPRLTLAQATTAIVAAEQKYWRAVSVEISECRRTTEGIACAVSATTGYVTACGPLVESGTDEVMLRRGVPVVYYI